LGAAREPNRLSAVRVPTTEDALDDNRFGLRAEDDSVAADAQAILRRVDAL
jgi:hypothetical protein